MALSKDWKEFLELLNSRGIDYVIVDGIPVFILGKDVLIRNKRAVGLPQDLADLAALEAYIWGLIVRRNVAHVQASARTTIASTRIAQTPRQLVLAVA